MSIVEFVSNPGIIALYLTGVGLGILASLRAETKKRFMLILVLTSIWPITAIGYIFIEFYNWYTGLEDE